MSGLRRAIVAVDRVLGRAESALLAGLVAVITAVTFAQVFSRYALADPIIWSEELARYLFVWITLIGGAAAVRLRGHFGLDILRRWSKGGAVRTLLGLLTTLVVGVFLAILCYAGFLEAQQARTQIASSLPISLQVPFLALPVGAALALFHLLAHWAADGIAAHPLDADETALRVDET